MIFKRIAGAVAFALLATAALAQTNRDGDPAAGQISFGFDGQDFNTNRSSSVGSIDATVRLSRRLNLETVASGGAYFGEIFGGGGAYLTAKPDAKTYITAGGGRYSNTDTTIAWSASLDAGRTLYQSERSAVHRSVIRAIETDFNVIERGYDLSPSVQILLLNPTITIYLPADWTLSLRAGAARESIALANTWTPSGGGKLGIPLTRRLTVSPGFGFDSELANVLQINNISSREFGSAMNFWLTKNASAGAYYFRVQYGTSHLASNSYGVSYAIRF